MAYKGRLVEFSKKFGIKTIKILKVIRDVSSLGENKGCETQRMCFLGGKIRAKNYQNSENNKGCL